MCPQYVGEETDPVRSGPSPRLLRAPEKEQVFNPDLSPFSRQVGSESEEA